VKIGPKLPQKEGRSSSNKIDFSGAFVACQFQGLGTPWKINIEPENDGLEDDFPFPEFYSQVPAVYLPGCIHLENKLLLISINFATKTTHSCLKKWYTMMFSRQFLFGNHNIPSFAPGFSPRSNAPTSIACLLHHMMSNLPDTHGIRNHQASGGGEVEVSLQSPRHFVSYPLVN